VVLTAIFSGNKLPLDHHPALLADFHPGSRMSFPRGKSPDTSMIFLNVVYVFFKLLRQRAKKAINDHQLLPIPKPKWKKSYVFSTNAGLSPEKT
jgi:hypothetical protein